MKLRIKKRNIQEVRSAVDQIEDIDPKIKDLVIGFRVWSIPTINSCQGHPDARPYPWLTIPFEYIKEAGRILCEWNYRQGPTNPINPVIWIIDPTAEPRIRTLVENPYRNLSHELESLQEDAIEFGQFLQGLSKDFDWSKDWFEE